MLHVGYIYLPDYHLNQGGSYINMLNPPIKIYEIKLQDQRIVLDHFINWERGVCDFGEKNFEES